MQLPMIRAQFSLSTLNAVVEINSTLIRYYACLVSALWISVENGDTWISLHEVSGPVAPKCTVFYAALFRVQHSADII